MTKAEYIASLYAMHAERINMALARLAEADANPGQGKLLIEHAYEWLALADNVLKLIDTVK